MLYLIFLLIITSAMLFALSISHFLQPRPKPILKLNEGNESTTRSIKRPLVFKFLRFFTVLNRYIVNRIGRKKLEDKILGANVGMLPEDFILIKEILLFLFIGLLFIFKKLFLGKDLIMPAIFIAVSLMGPDFWLRLRIKRRQDMVLKRLPDVIDLLSLCVNAGLDFAVAVKWVVDKSRPHPLIEELNLFLVETKMGKSRRQALEDMARRIDLPDVYSFSRALIQAERLGTPVESALNMLSEEVRDTRFRNGEKVALQAPIKMLFPLIFFIMPVVGIIVGGPILLQFLQGSVFTLK